MAEEVVPPLCLSPQEDDRSGIPFHTCKYRTASTVPQVVFAFVSTRACGQLGAACLPRAEKNREAEASGGEKKIGLVHQWRAATFATVDKTGEMSKEEN